MASVPKRSPTLTAGQAHLARRWRTLAESSGQIVWFADVQGQISDPGAWCAFTGQAPGSVMQSGWLAAAHPEDCDALLAQWQLALARQEPYQVEGRVRRADGSYRRLLVRGTPVYDDAGKVQEWVNCATDLSDLRQEDRHPPAFDALWLAIPDAVMRYDATGRAIQANAAFWHLVGLPATLDLRADATQVHLQHIAVQEADGTPLVHARRPVIRVLAGERDVESELRLRLPDGQERWIYACGTLVQEDDGTSSGVIMIYRDLTEHHRLVAERESYLHQLATILDVVPDGIAVYARDGQLLRANRTGRELLALQTVPDLPDLSADEIGQRLQIRDDQGQPLPPQQWPIARILRGETLPADMAVEIHVRTLAGQELITSTTGGAIRDATGVLQGVVTATRDITASRREEHRTHEALVVLLAMTRNFVDTPPRAIVADPNLTHFMAMAAQVLNIPRLDLLRLDITTDQLHPLAIWGYPEDNTQHWRDRFAHASLRQMLTDAQVTTLRAGEIVFQNERSGPLWLIPIVNQRQLIGVLRLDGGLARALHPVIDERLVRGVADLMAVILTRMIQEAAYQQAEARSLSLEETTRRMDEFLGIASHELRTPVTSVKGNVQMVARKLAKLTSGTGTELATFHTTLPPLVRLLERSDAALARLNRLVGDLLDVSRIQAGKLELRLETVNLVTLVQDAVMEVEASWPGRVLLVEVPVFPIPLAVDADRISQVVMNLLTNALKYAPANQPIHVRLRDETAQLRLEVEDFGPGLTLEQQVHLFERFYRAEGIEQMQGSGVGLGLGLFICQTIMQQHGGQVGVESHVGVGSTFWFSLPPPGITPPYQQAPLARQYTILLVEDSPEDAMVVLRYLRQSYGEAIALTHVATVAKATLVLTQQHQFDAVILDYFLPDGTAQEVMALLTQAAGTLRVPIILLSGAPNVDYTPAHHQATFLSKDALTPQKLYAALEAVRAARPAR